MNASEPLVDSLVNLRVANFNRVMNQLRKVCRLAEKLEDKGTIKVRLDYSQFIPGLAKIEASIARLQKRVGEIKLPAPRPARGGGRNRGAGGKGTLGSGELNINPAELDKARARFNELVRAAGQLRTALRAAGREDEIQRINQRLEELRRRLRSANSDSSLRQIGGEAANLRNQLARVGQATRDANAAFKQMSAGDVDRIRERMRNLRSRILQARIEADRFSSVFRNFAQGRLTAAQERLRSISRQLIDARRQTGPFSKKTLELQKAFDRAEQSARRLALATKAASIAASGLSTAARGIGAFFTGAGLLTGINLLTQGIEALGRTFSNLLSFNFGILRAGFTSVLAPVALLTRGIQRLIQFGPDLAAIFAVREITKAAQEFENFDDAIRKASLEYREFGAAGEKNLQRFEKLAIRVGRTTLATQEEIAEGIRELGRSGVDSAKVTEQLLRSIANFGQSAQLSMADATKAIITVSNQFGISFKEINRVADALQATANISPGTDVADLLPGFANVADSANQININLQETLAIFARFRQAGQGLSQAGTTLTTFAAKLQNALRDPAANGDLGNRLIDSIDQAAKRRGLTIADIIDLDNRQFVDGGFLRLLNVGETDKAVKDIIQQLTGIRGFRLNLLFRDTSRVQRAFDQIAESAGLVDNRVAAANKSIKSQRTLLNATISALKTQIANLFEGDAVRILDRLRNGFQSLSRQLELSGGFQTFIRNFQEGLRNLGRLLEPVINNFVRLSAFINTLTFKAFNDLAEIILPKINRLLENTLVKLEQVTGLQLRNTDFTGFIDALNIAIKNFDFQVFANNTAAAVTQAFQDTFLNTARFFGAVLVPVANLVGKAVLAGIQGREITLPPVNVRSIREIRKQFLDIIPNATYQDFDRFVDASQRLLAINKQIEARQSNIFVRGFNRINVGPLAELRQEAAAIRREFAQLDAGQFNRFTRDLQNSNAFSEFGRVLIQTERLANELSDTFQNTIVNSAAFSEPTQKLNAGMQKLQQDFRKLETSALTFYSRLTEGANTIGTELLKIPQAFQTTFYSTLNKLGKSNIGQELADAAEAQFNPTITSLENIQTQLASAQDPLVIAQQTNTQAVQENTLVQRQTSERLSVVGIAVKQLQTALTEFQGQNPTLIVTGS